LLNKYGVKSTEAQAFLEAHVTNQRFCELAELTRVLKAALTAPAVDVAPHPDHVL
jgi:hypothetical protein